MMDWGGSAASAGTEWKVTTSHTSPLTEKSQAQQSQDVFGSSGGAENASKVVLLGAPGVGKTSIVQKFVWGTFQPSYYPTAKKESYLPSIVMHDRNYPLKIVDIPDIPFFSVNSFYSLSDMQAYGLRDASAYVLVFDLLCPDSFDYIAGLFAQISESRDLGSIPVIVVGNKTDQVHKNLSTSRMRQLRKKREELKRGDEYHHDHDGFGGHGHGSGYGDHMGGHGSAFGGFHGHHDRGWGSGGGHSKSHSGGSKHWRTDKHKSGRKSSLFSRNPTGGSRWTSSSSRYSQDHDEDDDFLRSGSTTICNWATMGRESEEFLEKDICEKVTSEWKAIYRECSAQDAEAVTDVFKALVEVFEREAGGGDATGGDYYVGGRYRTDSDGDGLRRCVIL